MKRESKKSTIKEFKDIVFQLKREGLKKFGIIDLKNVDIRIFTKTDSILSGIIYFLELSKYRRSINKNKNIFSEISRCDYDN